MEPDPSCFEAFTKPGFMNFAHLVWNAPPEQGKPGQPAHIVWWPFDTDGKKMSLSSMATFLLPARIEYQAGFITDAEAKAVKPNDKNAQNGAYIKDTWKWDSPTGTHLPARLAE